MQPFEVGGFGVRGAAPKLHRNGDFEARTERRGWRSVKWKSS